MYRFELKYKKMYWHLTPPTSFKNFRNLLEQIETFVVSQANPGLLISLTDHNSIITKLFFGKKEYIKKKFK